MKYVHVYSGLEKEADEGALHWPWVAPDRVEVHNRVERARAAAREEVAARLASSPAVKPARKAAAARVRMTRRKAAAAAANAAEVEELEDGDDA